MSNEDFERRIRRLLNESVDSDLGPRPPAPQLQEHRRASRRPAWLLPLAVAATVAIISGGTAGMVHLVSEHSPVPAGGDRSVAQHPTAPSTPSTSPSRPAPSTRRSRSAPSSPSARDTTASSSTATPTSGGPAYALTRLGNARIAVPRGWNATRRDGIGGPSTPGWCLTPPGVSPGTGLLDCPVFLAEIPADGGNEPAILVDGETGLYGDPPQWCGAHASTTRVDSGDRDFGGRTAEWRLFRIRCARGSGRDIEQYVVPTDRAFVLVAPKEDATTSAGLTAIARHSVLPEQDRALRLSDYGILRSVTRRSGGYEISLDRVVEATGANENPATYEYFLPSRVLHGQTPKVGQKKWVFTNGTTVIQVY